MSDVSLARSWIRPLSLLAGAALATALLTPRSARACSENGCRYVYTGRGGPAIFPADTVAFATNGAPSAPEPTLVNDRGEAVPLVIKWDGPGRHSHWMPDRAIAPGSYVFTYDRRCFNLRIDGPESAEPDPVSFPVEVVKAGQLPKNLGTLVVEERGRFEDEFSSRGSFVRVRLNPSPAFVPYLDSTHWTVLVDGHPYQSRRSGPRDPLSVDVDCYGSGEFPPSGDSCGERHDVSNGRHRVAFVADVAGQQRSPITIERDVDISCAAPRALPAPAPSLQGGVEVGCAIARSPHSASAWPLLLLALAGLRRRR